MPLTWSPFLCHFEDFKSNQLHIYVYRKDVMDCILRTVKENIPEVRNNTSLVQGPFPVSCSE